MSTAYLVGAISALWFGILTSISPCPLATNIAAISYITKQIGKPRLVFFSGFLYAAGRMAAYLFLSTAILAGIFSMTSVSQFLMDYMNKLLGPLLIIIGMILMDLLAINLSGPGIGENMQRRLAGKGLWGAAALGMIFALSFCPISAALFFGSLIPLTMKFRSTFLFPGAFGFGTAVPVLAFGFVIAFSAQSVGEFFNRLSQFEFWVRRITGVLFILIGIYYTLTYIYGLKLK